MSDHPQLPTSGDRVYDWSYVESGSVVVTEKDAREQMDRDDTVDREALEARGPLSRARVLGGLPRLGVLASSICGSRMSTITREIPEGLCQCGCGRRTPLARQTTTRKGYVKGQPLRFINGHNGRLRGIDVRDETPYEVVDLGHDTPCWRWLYPLTAQGYASFRVDGRRRQGHAVYYERSKGPIPAGLELDHLCRVRACVNPDHLEPVTRAVNVRRGKMGKLTVEQLVACYEATFTEKDPVVAARFGISACYVNRIRHGHVPIPGVNA